MVQVARSRYIALEHAQDSNMKKDFHVFNLALAFMFTPVLERAFSWRDNMKIRFMAIAAVMMLSTLATAASGVEKYQIKNAEYYFDIDIPESDDDGLISGASVLSALSYDRVSGHIQVSGKAEMGGTDTDVAGTVGEVVVYGLVNLEDIRTVPTAKDRDEVECDQVSKNCLLTGFKLVVTKDETDPKTGRNVVEVDLRANLNVVRDTKLEVIEVTLQSKFDPTKSINISGLESNYVVPLCKAAIPQCNPRVEVSLLNQ
jgi:hypothetical protein